MTEKPDPRAKRVPSDAERAAAMEAYIKAGVEKAAVAYNSAFEDNATLAQRFAAGIEAVFRHLHLDHPENYLPK